jgi:hypothetical protein
VRDSCMGFPRSALLRSDEIRLFRANWGLDGFPAAERTVCACVWGGMNPDELAPQRMTAVAEGPGFRFPAGGRVDCHSQYQEAGHEEFEKSIGMQWGILISMDKRNEGQTLNAELTHDERKCRLIYGSPGSYGSALLISPSLL